MHIWSYLIVAFCTVVTSARNTDFPSNRNGFQGNDGSGVKDKKLWTPPTTSGLIIDSNGYPGNSNEAGTEERVEEFSEDDLPRIFKQVMKSLFLRNKANGYEIIPFSKEDILNMENSELCKTMCQSGVEKPPCKCK